MATVQGNEEHGRNRKHKTQSHNLHLPQERLVSGFRTRPGLHVFKASGSFQCGNDGRLLVSVGQNQVWLDIHICWLLHHISLTFSIRETEHAVQYTLIHLQTEPFICWTIDRVKATVNTTNHRTCKQNWNMNRALTQQIRVHQLRTKYARKERLGPDVRPSNAAPRQLLQRRCRHSR